MASEQLKTYHRKRGGLKHRLTNLTSYLQNIQDTSNVNGNLSESILDELQMRFSAQNALLAEFNTIQTDIESICEEDNLGSEYEERESFENSYYSTVSKLERILNNHASNCKNLEHSSNHTEQQLFNQFEGVKLPTIQLPKFSGSYLNWLEFKDTFESLIHNNSSISNIQRFHYLRAALEGSAAQVIKSIEFATANYEIAWGILCERYDNIQLLVHNHIKAIFDLPKVEKSSSIIFRQLIDDISKHLRALHALHQPTQHWDAIIIFLIANKLDKESVKQWEEYKKSAEFATLDEFKAFLKSKANLLETLEAQDTNQFQSQSKGKYQRHTSLVTSTRACNYCKGEHAIYHCADFLKLDAKTRIEKATALNLCLNCLRTGHLRKTCPYGSCRQCKGNHNSLLHLEQARQASPAQIALSSQNTNTQLQVLLATVQLLILDSKGKCQPCRAILDCGSQSNFVTKSFFDKLGLSKTSTNISIVGINQVVSTINYKCNATIKSQCSKYTANIPFFIIPAISENLPVQDLDISSVDIPANIQLADPNFNETRQIDALLGAGLFWEILRKGQIILGKSKPILQNTVFGWTVAGNLNLPATKKIHCHFSKYGAVQEQLQQFWEVEGNSLTSQWSTDEADCEQQYQTTTRRNEDGRFVVGIPFKDSPRKLGNSKKLALKRFYSQERKLQLNQKLKLQYVNFMTEYESMGHMTCLKTPIDDSNSYYFPHHGVHNEDSLTTKLRVVFDGSAFSDSGWSLNDLQHVGPIIQQDLLSILIRFRQHTYVFTSDISKMYRQIDILPEHRPFQRIWWRPDPSHDLNIFELNTVTYGTTSAPFLATRCLKQLALEHAKTYPEAAEIIMRDFYVDDFISGAETVNDAARICMEVTKILAAGCFELRKWVSNDANILKDIDNTNLLSHLQQFGNQKTKTLGLQWSSKTDSLTYQICSTSPVNDVTKRLILSQIAQIFDPLGLLAPCIILTKLILQKLWSLQLEWDEVVPEDLQSRWLQLRDNLQHINELSIPRHVICEAAVEVELHGFCDASQEAYGACVYVRSVSKEGEIHVRLFCAKTKVAPLKFVTIPRLELCGALLLSQLVNKLRNSITFKVNCYYWTDSQIVLCWIRTQTTRLQTFVANRTAEIQRITNVHNWRHVSTRENPADLLSRGLQPNNIANSKLWWQGPTWLADKEKNWVTSQEVTIPKTDMLEFKKQPCVTLLNKQQIIDTFPFKQFSRFDKLKRIIALCIRFSTNCKLTKTLRQTGALSVEELENSIKILVKLAQKEVYKEEIKLLQGNKLLNSKNHLSSLSPFIDNEGIMRVGGRIRNSLLNINTKHPILISGKHRLAELIFRHEHIQLLHAGPQLLLSSIREKFWVPSGRNLARKTVHNCMRCFRVKPTSITPLMGDLPAYRVQPAHPFLITGTDYAGPFLLRERRGRGVKRFKCYICIFICMCTRAIHLEPVTDLTTESFLATLKRFISRRGKPVHIYSDNGTTYVGANSELKELDKFVAANSNKLADASANQGINWHFIPAHSPNFGGIWEAGVKSTKHHLKRVLANSSITFEEFLTLLIAIEGILNSRPISPMSSDPNDNYPLTPAHFLIGRPITFTPEPDVRHLKQGRLSNFQLIQQIQQHFWERWSKEYLTELQYRTKWKSNCDAFPVGTLVLMKEDNLPPLQWKLGRIISLHPGQDGITRVVSIQTTKGVLKRAISKVCPLPIETE